MTARLLILVGIVLVGFGVALAVGVPIGRLPGDLTIRRGAVTFYLPLTTSVLISVVLTLVLMAVRR